MRSSDDVTHDPAAAGVAAEAAEQLHDAARALASIPDAMATSITSVHTVPADDVGSLRTLALRIAERYGLDVTFEEAISLTVRFSR